MKKLLLVAALGLGLLVLLVGVGIYFAGSIAKTAIERGGTYALGVPTTLESADLGLFSGRFGLHQLDVANPKGFSAPSFLRLSDARFEVELASLSSDLVEAPLLTLDGLEVTLVKRDGQTNYARILERLEELQAEDDAGGSGGQGEGGEEQAPSEGSTKKFVIREVAITNVVAHIDMVPQGGKLTQFTVNIPEIRLENVGQDGESLSQIVGELTQVLLAAIAQSGGGILPDEIIGDLQQGLGSLKAQAFELTQEVTARAELLGAELSEELGAEAEELLDSATKQVDKELKKLFE